MCCGRPGSFLSKPSEYLDPGASIEEWAGGDRGAPKPELGELGSAGPLNDLGDVYAPPHLTTLSQENQVW